MTAKHSFTKDIAAFADFERIKTVGVWEKPGKGVQIYWIADHLAERVPNLRNGNCHFLSAFPQLGSASMDEKVWSYQFLQKEILKRTQRPDIMITRSVIDSSVLLLGA